MAEMMTSAFGGHIGQIEQLVIVHIETQQMDMAFVDINLLTAFTAELKIILYCLIHGEFLSPSQNT
jgi:hypothetical protein